MTKREISEWTQPEWLDLRALRRYACVSERTLRTWIHRPIDPLPATQVSNKILIRRSAFDGWLETHKMQAVDIEGIVEDLIAGVRGTT